MQWHSDRFKLDFYIQYIWTLNIKTFNVTFKFWCILNVLANMCVLPLTSTRAVDTALPWSFTATHVYTPASSKTAAWTFSWALLFSNTVWECGMGLSEKIETEKKKKKKTVSVIDHHLKCWELFNVTHSTEKGI